MPPEPMPIGFSSQSRDSRFDWLLDRTLECTLTLYLKATRDSDAAEQLLLEFMTHLWDHIEEFVPEAIAEFDGTVHGMQRYCVQRAERFRLGGSP